MNNTYGFLLLSIICTTYIPASAQDIASSSRSAKITDTAKVFISTINITGNKHTKSHIILREIRFGAGDSLRKDKLPAEILQAGNQVYNTNLFTEVKIDSAYLPDNSLAVNVHVKEKWYIYPTPQFQLADRSFNEWIKRYHASFDRVVYGIKFAHYNFSGRRDQLRIYLLNGYARNMAISYSNPYSDKALNEGYSFSASYTQNREIGYQTNYNNRILNYKPGGFIRKSFGASVSLSRRNGYFRSQTVSAGISYINVTDSIILKYNPGFFNSRKSSHIIPNISYSFRYVNTNNNNYPLKGKIYGGSMSKTGTGFTGGVNSFNIAGEYAKYFTHKNNFYSSIYLSGFIRLPFEQAYINRRAMGFSGFYLRGLEDYVIDGVAAALIKYTFSKKILAFNIPVPFHIKALPVIPVKIFAKTYADAGYSYNKKQYDSGLNNRLLYSGGLGLDILTLYDINIRLEYSFNQLGEKGLFLHGRSGF